MKLSELTKTWLYSIHVFIIWFGGIFQIVHIYTARSAEDITLVWAICLLASEAVALPLSLSSRHRVWGWCHIGGTILCLVLLVGVILYGGS